MKITSADFKVIEELLPKQRGNVSISNLQVLNALSMSRNTAANGAGCRKKFGNWHTIYTRANRWSKNGVLDHVFAAMHENDVINIQVDHVSLDSTAVKVHPDGTGALKKYGPQSIGKSRAGWTTKIHLAAADARTAVTFSLSPSQAGDAPEGRKLLKTLENKDWECAHVIMDKAYEGDETRQLVLALEMLPVVPLKVIA